MGYSPCRSQRIGHDRATITTPCCIASHNEVMSQVSSDSCEEKCAKKNLSLKHSSIFVYKCKDSLYTALIANTIHLDRIISFLLFGALTRIVYYFRKPHNRRHYGWVTVTNIQGDPSIYTLKCLFMINDFLNLFYNLFLHYN